MKIIMDTRKY